MARALKHWTQILRIPLLALFLADAIGLNGQGPSSPASDLPDAPRTAEESGFEPPSTLPSPTDCELRNTAATMAATAFFRAGQVAQLDGKAELEPPRIVGITLCVPHMPPMVNWYARFVNGPKVKALTPAQKAHLAGRNVVDPFNLGTIAVEGAFAIGFDAHTPQGPGLHGYANYLGVSLTQDAVNEFFSTFLIPSIVHQDPHYHRMPEGSVPRRVVHAIDQVVWTQGDNGRGMLNYGDIVGFAAEVEVNNLYVPGQETDARASAARYATTLATAPIDNFITEFLPDFASRMHFRVVLVQRIINQVARIEGAPPP
jgi:hypothetical protein